MIYVPGNVCQRWMVRFFFFFFSAPRPRTLSSKLIKPLDNEMALIRVTPLSPYLGLAGITTSEEPLRAHCKHAEPRDSGYYRDFTLGRGNISAARRICQRKNPRILRRAWRRHPSENSIATHSVPLNCKISLAKRSGAVKFSCGFLSAKALFFCRKGEGGRG